MQKKGRIFLFTLFGFLLVVQTAVSAEQQPTASKPSNGALERIDPSDFFTQFEVRNEYRSQQSGAEINLLRPRFDYALSSSFQTRVEVPFI